MSFDCCERSQLYFAANGLYHDRIVSFSYFNTVAAVDPISTLNIMVVSSEYEVAEIPDLGFERV